MQQSRAGGDGGKVRATRLRVEGFGSGEDYRRGVREIGLVM